ncbi:hypothetical protein BSKO_01502 [Bryopsis sp. KO-2023]|nr:hypothetical protein BSKO_01502 [Bryopsis sp. KO-2023]
MHGGDDTWRMIVDDFIGGACSDLWKMWSELTYYVPERMDGPLTEVAGLTLTGNPSFLLSTLDFQKHIPLISALGPSQTSFIRFFLQPKIWALFPELNCLV